MSLNWREIALILTELPLEGSIIQKSYQIGFNALLLDLYHPTERFWSLYVEVGTSASRIHRSTQNIKHQKTKKLQRFIQFWRAHIEGAKIVAVEQAPADRFIRLGLRKRELDYNLILRLYSGPKANIIVCDSNLKILELLFRRPHQNEIAGETLRLPTQESKGSFAVRPYPPTLTFNQFIEQSYLLTPEDERDHLTQRIATLRRTEIAQLNRQLDSLTQRLERTSGYATYRHSGDLLSSAGVELSGQEEWVEVDDYLQEGHKVTISVDPSLTLGENIEAYYRKYSKGKGSYEQTLQAIETLKQTIDERQAYYTKLLTQEDHILKAALDKATKKGTKNEGSVGLSFKSGIFTLLVGRSAKENEELLRKGVRGNDWWMHNRHYSGAYVFIKSLKNKSIPLETLLDAANLALYYSKGRSSAKGDLYYTQVKYLRRVKGGKPGLVLPTQEKNITIKLDEERLNRLFSGEIGGE
ncbi:MAG: NFACT RNA binding domain-containing protein [Sphaerochaetaceae bacterium]